MRVNTLGRLVAFTVLLAASLPATDGYFSTGYGLKQQGQGGAGVAPPQDSLATATNPGERTFHAPTSDGRSVSKCFRFT